MKYKHIVFLGGLTCLTFSKVSFALSPFIKATSITGQEMEAVPGQVLVRYKKDSRDVQARILKTYRTQSQDKNEAIGVETLQVPAGETVDSFVRELKKNPDVEFAEPNGYLHAFASTPNDPSFASQYYLDSTKLNILNAWDITRGTSTIVVAVVDTGIDLTHVDISTNLWDNPGTLTSTSGLHGARMKNDLNGDGDCTDNLGSDGLEECASNDPTDNNGHGTHVSGEIAAITNNGTNMAGICPNCRLMGVKVLNNQGVGTFTAIAAGITYAVDHGASVMNLSLGGPTGSASVEAAVAYAIEHNVVVVAASGNTPFCAANLGVSFPASISRVIAVGATTTSDQLASFSCRGSALDLTAPGDEILSTKLGGGIEMTNEDGTSFASPMVTAVAALLRSLNPNLTVNEVTTYLNFNADDLGATGWDSNFGFGRLDAYQTLLAAQSGTIYFSNPGFPSETFPQPNPYNPTLGQNVEIKLPTSLLDSQGQAPGLEITIFNLSGEIIKTISGTNQWNGKNDDGNYVASGFYLYHVKTSKGDVKGKLTVVK